MCVERHVSLHIYELERRIELYSEGNYDVIFNMTFQCCEWQLRFLSPIIDLKVVAVD